MVLINANDNILFFANDNHETSLYKLLKDFQQGTIDMFTLKAKLMNINPDVSWFEDQLIINDVVLLKE